MNNCGKLFITYKDRISSKYTLFEMLCLMGIPLDNEKSFPKVKDEGIVYAWDVNGNGDIIFAWQVGREFTAMINLAPTKRWVEPRLQDEL